MRQRFTVKSKALAHRASMPKGLCDPIKVSGFGD